MRCYECERDTGVERELLVGKGDPPCEISQGVRAKTLNWILRENDISYHSFDILNKRFDRHVSRHRNYPLLVYYAENDQMYYVGDRRAAMSLIQTSSFFETKINSEAILLTKVLYV